MREVFKILFNKLGFIDLLGAEIDGGEGVRLRVQEARCVKSLFEMVLKQIIYQVTYFGNRDGLSSSCLQSLFLCRFLFPPSSCAPASCAATATCGFEYQKTDLSEK